MLSATNFVITFFLCAGFLSGFLSFFGRVFCFVLFLSLFSLS